MTTEETTLTEMLAYIAQAFSAEQQAQIHVYAAKLRAAFVSDPLLAVAAALVA